MLDTLQIADFDLDISEVLLVHKNTFVHLFKWNEYRTGRCFDGVTFCVSGSAIFDFGDSRIELLPGQALFLPSVSSYVVRCESEEPFVHYTVNFRLGIDPTENESPEPTAFSEITSGKLHHVTGAESAETYLPIFEKLLSVWQGKHTGYRVMAKALIYELLYIYFTDAGRSHRDKDEYDKLLPARRVLDRRFAEDQSIAELAALCSMSETHFRRKFAKLFGMSPTEYRLEKRILRAKDLLISGQYSIAETAREVGYSDPNYFARVFRRIVGTSPRDFMRS